MQYSLFRENLGKLWHQYYLLVLIIFLIIIHSILAPFTGQNHDIAIWVSVQRQIAHGINLYEFGQTQPEYYAYPPLWALILLIFYPFTILFNENIYLIRYIIKFPLLIAWILTAWLSRKVILEFQTSVRDGSKEKNILEKNSNAVFIFILFNPVILTVSSIWGMFDIISACFAVIAIYFGERVRKSIPNQDVVLETTACAIFAAFSFLLKLYPIILFLPLLILMKEKKQKLIFVLVYFATSAIICFPFYFWNPEAFISAIGFHGTRIGGGVTFWNYFWIPYAEGQITELEFREITANYLRLLLPALLLAVILILTRKNQIDNISACFLVTVTFFSTYKLIYEQYTIFLLVIAGLYVFSRIDTFYDPKVVLLGLLTSFSSLYILSSWSWHEIVHLEFLHDFLQQVFDFPFIPTQYFLVLIGSLFVICQLVFVALVVLKEGTVEKKLSKLDNAEEEKM